MTDQDSFWRELEALLLEEERNEEALHLAMNALLQQQQGGAAAVDDEADRAGPFRGRFHFRLEPIVDRRSQRLGVHKRVFQARAEQQGTFDHHDQLAARFVEELRSAMAWVLDDDSIADRDRIYFHLASDRLRHAYDGWGLSAANGVVMKDGWHAYWRI